MSNIKKFPHVPSSVTKPDYEKAELDLLRDGIKMTFKERFEAMMNLIKMSQMLQGARVSKK